MKEERGMVPKTIVALDGWTYFCHCFLNGPINFYTTLSQFLHRKKYQKHWPSPLPLSSQLGGGHLSALLEEELAPVHVGIYQVLIMPGAGWLLLGRCH
jgi:hypothetical protein